MQILENYLLLTDSSRGTSWMIFFFDEFKGDPRANSSTELSLFERPFVSFPNRSTLLESVDKHVCTSANWLLMVPNVASSGITVVAAMSH